MIEPKQTIAITGASGFLGRILCRRLAEAGYRLSCLTRETTVPFAVAAPGEIRWVHGSLSSPDACARLVEGASTLVHVARFGNRMGKGEPLIPYLEGSVLGAAKLFQTALDRRVSQIINVSSTSAARLSLEEAAYNRRTGLNNYPMAKAAVDLLCKHLHQVSGASICTLRPSSIVGLYPNLSYSPGYGIASALWTGNPAETGAQPAAMVHVEDVARAIEFLIGHPQAGGKAFDCTSPEPCTFADVARALAELVPGGRDLLIVHAGAAVAGEEPLSPQALIALGFQFSRAGLDLAGGYAAELLAAIRSAGASAPHPCHAKPAGAERAETTVQKYK